LNEWGYSLLSASVVSLVSLIGIMSLMLGVRRIDRVIPLLISLAVGSLFGDAFIHLLPEAFSESTNQVLTSLYIIVGILLFLVMESLLHWHHEHHTQTLNPIHPVGQVILVADGVHNLLDGLIIGASYLVSVPVGLATTLAVLLHEVPQELGDFGVLLHAGFTPRRALIVNFLSAILAVVGVVISLLLGGDGGRYTAVMVPITAGGFIYIAGADLIPELHKEHELRASLAQIAVVMIGIGLVFLPLLVE